jgi:hypothetical protein
MFVLVEAYEECELPKAQELWEFLSEVYAAHTDLLELADDKRKLHAAELIVTAWNAHLIKIPGQGPNTPDFVVALSNRLAEYRASFKGDSAEGHLNTGDFCDQATTSADETIAEGDFEFGMDLQDIDWSFWSSID